MMHNPHPSPSERKEFLVDGCPRCAEYVRDLGVPFDAARFRAFWAKMIAVEFNDNSGYASELDKKLGRSLYLVALSLQRAFGLQPEAVLWYIDDFRSETMTPVTDAGSLRAVTIVSEKRVEIDESAEEFAVGMARLGVARLRRQQTIEDCPGHEWGLEIDFAGRPEAFCEKGCGARRSEHDVEAIA